MKAFILELCREAGDLALAGFGKLQASQISGKLGFANDLVTETDKAIESLLRKRILARFPDHAILGEEEGETGSSQTRWIIDPIDGTGSFVHHQPYFSISIAVEISGTLTYAAVHAPAFHETFWAQVGAGAWLGDERLQVTARSELSECMLATGFACMRSKCVRNNLPIFNAIMPKIRDIRRAGSAALDLAYVAAGRLDGFWELHLNEYDVAAGHLLVKEAGGTFTDFSGGSTHFYEEVLATNGHIFQDMKDLLTEVK